MRPQYYEHDDMWIEVPTPQPLPVAVRGTKAVVRATIRSALLNALAFTNGHQAQAAQLLGISTRTLTYKLRTYGIPLAHAGEGRQPSGRKPKGLGRASDR